MNRMTLCWRDVNHAFGSLLRVLNYPPKVTQPKYSEKKELDFSRKVQIDDEAEKKIEDGRSQKDKDRSHC